MTHDLCSIILITLDFNRSIYHFYPILVSWYTLYNNNNPNWTQISFDSSNNLYVVGADWKRSVVIDPFFVCVPNILEHVCALSMICHKKTRDLFRHFGMSHNLSWVSFHRTHLHSYIVNICLLSINLSKPVTEKVPHLHTQNIQFIDRSLMAATFICCLFFTSV